MVKIVSSELMDKDSRTCHFSIVIFLALKKYSTRILYTRQEDGNLRMYFYADLGKDENILDVITATTDEDFVEAFDADSVDKFPSDNETIVTDSGWVKPYDDEYIAKRESHQIVTRWLWDVDARKALKKRCGVPQVLKS